MIIIGRHTWLRPELLDNATVDDGRTCLGCQHHERMLVVRSKVMNLQVESGEYAAALALVDELSHPSDPSLSPDRRTQDVALA